MRRVLPLLFVLAAAAALLSMARFAWPFTMDDSFITFRYAANLAAGFGPTWNPGLPPAEGYTTFLWVAVMALPHALHLDAEVFAKVAGLAITLATMGVVYLFVYRLTSAQPVGRRHLAAAAGAAMLGCHYGAALHAVSGMETALATFLLTAFLCLTVAVAERPSRSRIALLTVTGLLLGLTRPEANLLVGVGLLALLVVLPRERRLGLVAAAAALYAVPYAAYFAWRLAYYGHLFPLPFYTKIAATRSFAGTLLGLISTGQFLHFVALRTCVLPLLGLLVCDRRLVPALVAVGSLFVFYFFPVHMMNFAWRFLHPTLPFLFVLSASGLAALIGWVESRAERLTVPRRLLVAALYLVVPVAFVLDAPPQLERIVGDLHKQRPAHVILGQKLAAFDRSPREHVVAMADAGALPYFSGWRAIDTFSLNDPNIAIHRNYDPQYVLSHKPDLLVLVSTSADQFKMKWYLFPWEDGLYRAAEAQGYARVQRLTVGANYYLWLLARPESAIAAYLRAWNPPPPPD